MEFIVKNNDTIYNYIKNIAFIGEGLKKLDIIDKSFFK